MTHSLRAIVGAALLALAGRAAAAPSFVNGLVLDAAALDLSGGSTVNTGRLGYFSDIYYDNQRQQWWGLSDRGPGGGTLDYAPRMQRFSVDVDNATGAISNFKLQQTVVFSQADGSSFNGKAPALNSVLGNSLDPEGLVVNPRNGNFLVAEEYGLPLLEFDPSGQLLKRYSVPANLLPKVGTATDYNTVPPTLNHGREVNRGLEGLAISPDGKFAFAMLQNGTLDDGYNLGTASRGNYTRIVKYDTDTDQAVGQYACKLQSTGQGRGISALVAVNDHQFLLLGRNNRGVGVPNANLASPDKKVYLIDLANATDVSTMALNNAGTGFTAAATSSTAFIDLAAAGSLQAALGGVSPEIGKAWRSGRSSPTAPT